MLIIKTMAAIAAALALSACGGGGEPTETPDAGPCAGFEVTHLPEVDHEQGMYALRDSRRSQYLVDGTGTVFTTSELKPNEARVRQCADTISLGRAYTLVVLNSTGSILGTPPVAK